MTEASDPGPYEDVNEAVGTEWEEETTPYERVRTVIARTYTAMSADAVADRARTSPKTARKHLETMAAEGFVSTEPGAHGGTHYRRSSDSLVLEQATSILEETPKDELERRVTEMRRKLGEFRETYGADSPAELSVARTNDVLSGTEDADGGIDDGTVREWKTTERNLAFANAALAIANARQFVGRHADGNRSLS